MGQGLRAWDTGKKGWAFLMDQDRRADSPVGAEQSRPRRCGRLQDGCDRPGAVQKSSSDDDPEALLRAGEGPRRGLLEKGAEKAGTLRFNGFNGHKGPAY